MVMLRVMFVSVPLSSCVTAVALYLVLILTLTMIMSCMELRNTREPDTTILPVAVTAKGWYLPI